MMKASEYRAMADRVTAEARAKVVKDAKNYINAVVEPTVLVKANKGLYDCTIVVPNTIDMDYVAELLEEVYFFGVSWDADTVEETRTLRIDWQGGKPYHKGTVNR